MFFMQVLHEELARLREQRKVLKDQIKEQTKQQRNLLARRRRLLQASRFDIFIVGVGFLPTQIEAARNLSREDLELLLLRGVDLCRCAGKPVGWARVAQIFYAGANANGNENNAYAGASLQLQKQQVSLALNSENKGQRLLVAKVPSGAICGC